jgi:tetratricopeptide (TPR) repeat protein
MKVFILVGFITFLFFTNNIAGQDTTAKAAFERGTTLARADKFEKAAAEFEIALREALLEHASDRRIAQIHFNIGVCRYRLEDLDSAVTELKIAIKLQTDYEKAFYALGMAAAGRHNLSAAESAFVAAIKIKNRDAEAWFDLGNVYLEQKELAKARSAFEMAAKYKTIDLAVSHNNIGVIAALSGDLKTAVAEFVLALKLSGGQLQTARNNLELCRRSLPRETLAAELRFGVRASA